MVKPVLSHHLYDEAVTVEGVGQGDYCGQDCFKSPPLLWGGHCRRCERETTVVKSVLSHHLYDEAFTVEGVGEGDYYGQVCFKSQPL